MQIHCGQCGSILEIFVGLERIAYYMLRVSGDKCDHEKSLARFIKITLKENSEVERGRVTISTPVASAHSHTGERSKQNE